MTHIMLAPPVKRRHEGDPESDSGLSTNAPTGHRIKSMKQHLEADVTGSLTPQRNFNIMTDEQYAKQLRERLDASLHPAAQKVRQETIRQQDAEHANITRTINQSREVNTKSAALRAAVEYVENHVQEEGPQRSIKEQPTKRRVNVFGAERPAQESQRHIEEKYNKDRVDIFNLTKPPKEQLLHGVSMFWDTITAVLKGTSAETLEEFQKKDDVINKIELAWACVLVLAQDFNISRAELLTTGWNRHALDRLAILLSNSSGDDARVLYMKVEYLWKAFLHTKTSKHNDQNRNITDWKTICKVTEDTLHQDREARKNECTGSVEQPLEQKAASDDIIHQFEQESRFWQGEADRLNQEKTQLAEKIAASKAKADDIKTQRTFLSSTFEELHAANRDGTPISQLSEKLRTTPKQTLLDTLANGWRLYGSQLKVVKLEEFVDPLGIDYFDCTVISVAQNIMMLLRLHKRTPKELLATGWEIETMKYLSDLLDGAPDNPQLQVLKLKTESIWWLLREAHAQLESTVPKPNPLAASQSTSLASSIRSQNTEAEQAPDATPETSPEPGPSQQADVIEEQPDTDENKTGSEPYEELDGAATIDADGEDLGSEMDLETVESSEPNKEHTGFIQFEDEDAEDADDLSTPAEDDAQSSRFEEKATKEPKAQSPFPHSTSTSLPLSGRGSPHTEMPNFFPPLNSLQQAEIVTAASSVRGSRNPNPLALKQLPKNCRYPKCTNQNCAYQHAPGQQVLSSRGDKRSSIMCLYKPICNKQGCPFDHPSQRFDGANKNGSLRVPSRGLEQQSSARGSPLVKPEVPRPSLVDRITRPEDKVGTSKQLPVGANSQPTRKPTFIQPFVQDDSDTEDALLESSRPGEATRVTQNMRPNNSNNNRHQPLERKDKGPQRSDQRPPNTHTTENNNPNRKEKMRESLQSRQLNGVREILSSTAPPQAQNPSRQVSQKPQPQQSRSAAPRQTGGALPGLLSNKTLDEIAQERRAGENKKMRGGGRHGGRKRRY